MKQVFTLCSSFIPRFDGISFYQILQGLICPQGVIEKWLTRADVTQVDLIQ